MHKYARLPVTLFGLVFGLFSATAFAQDRVAIERALFMAQIDYDVAHATFIDGCKAKYPESVPALVESISAWKVANYEAQVELQKVLRRISGISPQAVAEQFRKVTGGYGYSLLHLPANEFRDGCEGTYARITLQLPQMNFAAVLMKLQSSPEFAEQPNPAVQGTLRDKAAQRP